jgi:hypothetical protein
MLISGGDINLVNNIVTSRPTVLSPFGQTISTFLSFSQLNGAAESAAAAALQDKSMCLWRRCCQQEQKKG